MTIFNYYLINKQTTLESL